MIIIPHPLPLVLVQPARDRDWDLSRVMAWAGCEEQQQQHSIDDTLSVLVF